MKKLKFFIFSVCFILFIFSVIYLWTEHKYDLTKIEEIKTDENYINVTYDRVEDINKSDVLGILTIDKIGLRATVKEGSKSNTLKDYIGHIEETSKFDGNIGLAAHNRNNKYSYFARLNELKKGDLIIYETKYYKRYYKVERIETIYETDWSTLKNTKENRITMITCISGKRDQRLSVQAVQIKE